MSALADLDSRFKDLITRALDTSYVSTPFPEGPKTANRYQSLDLGDGRTSGFRGSRDRLLDQIDFTGKHVLDLGSNLGELSRAARSRGARLVDGFEVDPFFIEISDLVNAFTGTTRVSFYERDISDPDCYEDHYDIVLAFAVYGQGVKRCLPRIAEVTDVVVVETHKLVGTFDAQYMRPFSRHFPHHRMLGESDWGAGEQNEARVVVAFAKTEADLRDALAAPDRATSRGRGESLAGATIGAPEAVRYLDVARSFPQKRFFSRFAYPSGAELLAAIDATDVDLEEVTATRDLRVNDYHSWAYWLLYAKGYCQYRQQGAVGPGNIYYDYLVSHRVRDPNLAAGFGDPAVAAEMVSRRFRDMDLCRDGDPEQVAEQMAPLRAVVAGVDPTAGLEIYEPGSPAPLKARYVDGWHRLFAARAFGVPRLRLELLETERTPFVRGAIERLDYDGRRLRVQGWCADPDGSIDKLEVRTDAKGVRGADARGTLAVVATTSRRDGVCGFEIDCDCELAEADLVRFDFLALNDWLPVGRMRAFHVEGMYDEHPEHAEALARHEGGGDRHAVAIRSLSVLREMLEPLERYRALHTFQSVLDCGSDGGLLQLFLRRFLPEADVALQVDLADLDAESFDLVLGHALGRLSFEQEAIRLEHLHRVMRSEGYAALTVPSKTAGMVIELATRFDVIARLEGGADGDEDLILLRQP